MRLPTTLVPVLVGLGLLAAGCGSESKDEGSQTEGRLPGAEALRAELQASTKPAVEDFPAVEGRSLSQVADSLTGSGPQVGLAASVFVPGKQRLAFGVIDEKTGFVYGKTAVYVGRTPVDRAEGPFLAPADLLITDPAYSSKQAATETDPFAAIYAAEVPFKQTGKYSVLVVTKLDNGETVGAATEIKVIPQDRDTVVGVGEKAPAVPTDTLDSAGGNIEAIETRQPPDSMHDVNLADVVGKKPVALVFATPQLCESRVCGPVVDIVEQLKQSYGDEMAFIHQEVFQENDPNKGLRKPLTDYGLRSEPWLFVIDRTGKVTARLEGSFGFDAVKRALASGLS